MAKLLDQKNGKNWYYLDEYGSWEQLDNDYDQLMGEQCVNCFSPNVSLKCSHFWYCDYECANMYWKK